MLDISLARNRADLERLLAEGAVVQYFDHHFAGELPESERFEAHIDTSAEVCTSLLVNDYLGGRHLSWAVAAAFGDNLFDSAGKAAAPLNLSDERLQQLELLGTLLNYNGYGATPEDLYIRPEVLYREIRPYADPFAFMAESPAFRRLDEGYKADIVHARRLQAEIEDEQVMLVMLPDAAWARRVAGTYGNELARSAPNRAHALATELSDGAYLISVRAPLANKNGADELCMQFPTGGGRKGAAGINHLPAAMLDDFVKAFREKYS